MIGRSGSLGEKWARGDQYSTCGCLFGFLRLILGDFWDYWIIYYLFFIFSDLAKTARSGRSEIDIWDFGVYVHILGLLDY